MSLAAHDSEFRRWSGGVDRRICQTFAASPAEPAAKERGKKLGGPKQALAAKLGAAANKEAADKFAANALPIIRQVQASGFGLGAGCRSCRGI
jgi:hypothetical protein